jgi:hypothetical protein
VRQLLLAAALIVALVACEKTQSGPSVRKSDTKAWDAAQNPFVAPGWKTNDEASWESQMRERAAWQNEYPRVSGRQ